MRILGILLIVLIYCIIGVFVNGIDEHIESSDFPLEEDEEFILILLWPMMLILYIIHGFAKIFVCLSRFITGFLDSINKKER